MGCVRIGYLVIGEEWRVWALEVIVIRWFVGKYIKS